MYTIAVDVARKILKEDALTQEIVDILIDRILVYPDKRIEIVWRIEGFTDCLPNERVACVAI